MNIKELISRLDSIDQSMFAKLNKVEYIANAKYALYRLESSEYFALAMEDIHSQDLDNNSKFIILRIPEEIYNEHKDSENIHYMLAQESVVSIEKDLASKLLREQKLKSLVYILDLF